MLPRTVTSQSWGKLTPHTDASATPPSSKRPPAASFGASQSVNRGVRNFYAHKNIHQKFRALGLSNSPTSTILSPANIPRKFAIYIRQNASGGYRHQEGAFMCIGTSALAAASNCRADTCALVHRDLPAERRFLYVKTPR
jgi:hypothetical protein